MKLGLLALCSTALLLPACDAGKACTDIAASSVTLEVVDAETDEALPDADVTFTLDGGDAQMPAEVDGNRFVLAYEETGVFAVTVTADGYEQAEVQYDIVLDDDGCHPVGESDTIELARMEQ